MKKNILFLVTILLLGCQSKDFTFLSYSKSFEKFTFHNDKNETFSINTFSKNKKNKDQYFLLIESHGGSNALEEEACGKIAKMSFPEEAKYCFQVETAFSVLSPHNRLTIIESFEYPPTLSYSEYKTTTKTAKYLRNGYEGFRVTLINSNGIVLKQSKNVLWPKEIKMLIKRELN